MLYGLTLISVMLWTALWPERPVTALAPAEAIVCLGAGATPAGEIGRASNQRAQSCIDLYEAGRAPLIAFTGGIADTSKTPSVKTPSVAALMAAQARKRGVPERAILEEHRSLSTLQNALFTLPLMPETAKIILVTESYHLPRSYVSFKWAGLILAPSEITVFAAHGSPGAWLSPPGVSALLRETTAIWFNLLRASLWTAAHRFGIAQDGWLH